MMHKKNVPTKKPASFTVEKRGSFLYLEYIGDYDKQTYKQYFYSFLRHPSFGKLPVIQKTNFTQNTNGILSEVGSLYKDNIAAYPYKWALIVKWEIYHISNDNWQDAANGVLLKRKMFTDIKDAESWISGMTATAFNVKNIIKIADMKLLKFVSCLTLLIGGGGAT